MTATQIKELLNRQREYFQTGETFSVSFRADALKRLKAAIKRRERDIQGALYADLAKSYSESYMCEIGMVYEEIRYFEKNLKKLTKATRVRTPLAQFAAKSYAKSVPYGNVLIMSPWNYPFLLTIDPLVDAIAAGNTAIVKPSAYSKNTSGIMAQIIKETFDEKYIAVVEGGREENANLLENKFDLVFFTGSEAVGKIVLRNTAEHLIPAVLELGGKSPVIVDASANIPLAAKRIVFGKFINCGQTCVAPDYILCDRTVKDELVAKIIYEIEKQFSKNPLKNLKYGRIINKKHFERLCSLIDSEKTVCGGKSDASELRIEPTVMDNVTFDDAVMQEEIFGPILPIITYDNIDEVYNTLKDRPKPLALYVFSENKKNIAFITERIQFGGGCVNDTVIHLATTSMGFGGVGESGMGSYHGKTGFDTFSHKKSIVDKKTWLDLPMRYQPYSDKKDGLIRKFLK